MIKKLLILFIFLISLNTIYSYNDSLTDLYLDYNIISDCAGKDISFLVMNSSDYESRDEIEDDLCGINETPDKDNCLKFDLIDNAEITIYNGVFDELPILYSGKTNKSGNFNFKFNKSGYYLFKISKHNNYNTLKEKYLIRDCTQNLMDYVIVKDNLDLPSKTFNSTFNYPNEKVTLTLKNSNSNNSKNISISTINLDSKNITQLNNTIKSIEIKSNTLNYTNMKIQIEISKKENSTLKVYKYNFNTNKFEEKSFKIENNNIILESADFGIYSITEKEQETTTQETTTQETTTKATENKNLELIGNESSTNMIIWIVAISIIFILLISFIVINSKKSKEPSYNNEKLETKSIKKEEKEEIKTLNNYTDVYNNTKQYTQKYKVSYSKDQIYRALKQANTPSDIINKVFAEEF